MKKLFFHPVLLVLLFLAQTSSGQNESTSFTAGETNKVDADANHKASFPNLSKYIGEKLQYPALAQKNGAEGDVTVEALIGETGEVLAVGLVQGIGFGCDQELMKLVSNMPKWSPAIKNGHRLAQKVFIRTHFKLQ